jgi:hypothetical protein
MHDAATAVRGFQTELEPAVSAAVEGDAPADQVVDSLRGSTCDALDHWNIAQAGAGSHGIGCVQSRVVVDSDGGGDAALSPGAGRAGGEGRLGQHDDGLGCQMQGSQKPGKTAADDDRLAGKRLRC